MSRTAAALFAAAALIAAALVPAAQASTRAEAMPTMASGTATGADCEWGTEPAQVIPTIDYPAGYTGYNY
ncbi:MAG: hypothetical protein ACO3LZ_05855, partial [Candidatus Nanopelagicales bacterium]